MIATRPEHEGSRPCADGAPSESCGLRESRLSKR